MNTHLIIELLDSSLGHSIQAWELESSHSVQIGRSPDSDVMIRNPYVSRCHACIVAGEDGWVLNGVSSQGLVYEDKIVQSIEIRDAVIVRLSRRGPLLRISLGIPSGDAEEDELSAMATIGQDDFAVPLLILDKETRDKEVAEIEKEDYFASLKEIAQKLRQQKEQ